MSQFYIYISAVVIWVNELKGQLAAFNLRTTPVVAWEGPRPKARFTGQSGGQFQHVQRSWLDRVLLSSPSVQKVPENKRHECVQNTHKIYNIHI